MTNIPPRLIQAFKTYKQNVTPFMLILYRVNIGICQFSRLQYQYHIKRVYWDTPTCSVVVWITSVVFWQQTVIKLLDLEYFFVWMMEVWWYWLC